MRSLATVLLMSLSGLACADNFVYAGVGVVRDSISSITTNEGFSLDDIHHTSWKAVLGVRPISFVAAEVNYVDLGSQSRNFIDVAAQERYKAFAGYVVGFLPLPVPFLDVFGKAGLARWQADGSNYLFSGGSLISFSDRGTEFAWGAGAGVHFGRVGARLEYESFNIPNTSGAHLVSLDVLLSFL